MNPSTPPAPQCASVRVERRAYIARYTLNHEGNDLVETILHRDTYASPALFEKWDVLVAERKPFEPMLQFWYSDDYSVSLEATTNQPFKLD